MKKMFSNKFVVALTIIAVAGAAVYMTTWGNKNWLIRQIAEKGGTAPKADGSTPALQLMNNSQLRSMLKSLS